VNTLFRRIGVTTAVVAAVTCSATPRAHACIDGMNTFDATMNEICFAPFLDWFQSQFQMNEGWNGWGQEQRCNKAMPYAKAAMAGWLVGYALQRDTDRPPFSNQFHAHRDYRALTSANGGVFHASLYYATAETRDWNAQYSPGGTFSDRKIRLACPLFDNNQNGWTGWSNPTHRASDFVHETWHAYMDEKRLGPAGGSSSGHVQGPNGNCRSNKANCDYWYWHTLGDYPYGTLQVRSTSPKYLSHSVQQIQIEYLCDLNLNATNTPLLQAMSARSMAAARMPAIINTPGDRCDRPRFFSKTFCNPLPGEAKPSTCP